MSSHPDKRERPAIFKAIADQFPAQMPPDDYGYEFIFQVKLDFRDWREVLKALAAQPSAGKEAAPSSTGEPHPDTLALTRLIELLRAMDKQAERITEQQGDEEIIVGYKWKTGLWHRVLGTIAGHDTNKWLRTPEGQDAMREAGERAAQAPESMNSHLGRTTKP